MESNQRGRMVIHRSAEQWRELIAAWKSSGKAAKAWCQEQGIAYESLRRWKKRLGKPSADVSFAEVQLHGRTIESPVSSRVKVNRDGEIELYGNVSEELLRAVVHVMRETAGVH